MAYQKGKARAREEAISWQMEFDGKCLSWYELSIAQSRFEYLGRRFGLIREFRENGIL
ncbi:MAG: hypothetical protein IJI27_05465 [Oscillospiraceae bacterium]|nr:hypothetical protein [Oscillospiraceae bacterium]